MAQGKMHKETAQSLPDPNVQKFKDKGTKTSKVGANRPCGKNS